MVVAAGLAILALDWAEVAVSVPRTLRQYYVGTLLFILAALLIVVFGRYGVPADPRPRRPTTRFNTAPVSALQPERPPVQPVRKRTDRAVPHRLAAGVAPSRCSGAAPAPSTSTGSSTGASAAPCTTPTTCTWRRSPSSGSPGLLLLALALGVPLAAVRRARRSPLASVAFAAYVAFLVHASVDWDWEMPALTLAALLCGLALLAAGPTGGRAEAASAPHSLGRARRNGSRSSASSLLGLLGNTAVSASSKSPRAGHLARAASQARRAMHFAPWSSAPWRRLGEAQANSGDRRRRA